MRLGLRAFGVYVGLILAVGGGGFMNAAVGPVGAAIYGAAVALIVIAVALRARRSR